jgi:hypothetical protein
MNRKSVVYLALLLGLAVWRPASAQESTQVYFGLAGGPTASRMRGEFAQSSDLRWGALVGGFVRSYPEDNFAIEFGVNWVQKGGSNVLTADGDSLDLRLSYLEFPLLLDAILPLNRTWDVGVYTGIVLGIRTSCDVTEQGSSSVSCSADAPGGEPSGTEWSWPLGAGVGAKIGSRSYLGLDFRYSLGLTEVFKTNNAKTSTLEFLLRYAYRLR